MAISEIATIPNLPFGNSRNPKPFKLQSNPKILGFRCESEMIERSPTPIIDRFRFLLRDRDEKLKISEEDDDVAEVYEIVLAELTHNSKPIITELTMIAEEQREHAEGIANAICNQIREVPSEQKLPSLYLLDSIVKNIGYEYIEYFASRLPEVFCQTYKQVQRGKHGAMQLLFGTWPAVFPPSVLQKIRTELKFSPPVNHRSPASASSESPSQGIHVNFKQLDAGHQFEHTTTDVQDARGISSYVQRCGQKPHFGYDEHSIYQTDIISNHVEIKRLKSPGRDTHTSEGKVERLISPKTKPIRPSSPAESLSPSDDQLQTDNSSRRAVQKASPSRCGFQNPPGRVNKRVTKKNDWSVESLSPPGDLLQTNNSPRRAVRKVSPSRCGFQNQPRRVNKGVVKKNNWGNNHSLDRNNRYTESYNMCDFSNLNDLDRPRALIEAYGRDSREDNLYEKPPKTDWHDLNGINRETATRSWQNTDDNEYVWEEMSPKLAGRSMNNEVMVPKLNFGNISTIMGTEDAGVLSKPNIRMGNWPRNPKLPTVGDSAIIAEEEISKSGGGTAGDESVFGSEANKNHDLYYPRHPWNEQKNFSDGIAGDESLFGSRIQTEANKKHSPYQPHHPWNKQKNFAESSRKRNLEACRNAVQTSAPSSEPILPTCERMPFVMDNLENSSSIAPAVVKKHLGKRSCSSPKEPQLRPQVDVTNSQPPPSPPILPHQKQTNGQFFLDARKQLINQGRNDGSILPQQQFDDVVESETFDSRKLPHLPLPLEGLASLNNQHQGQVAPSPPQVLKYQEVPSIPIHSVSSTSFQLQGVPLTPLPPGTPPASSQMRPSQVVDPIASQLPSQTLVPIASHPSAVSAFSGLISSLMAYGLISLTAPSTIQDSVGVEFKTDLLKVRQESVITTLYADLPRQCTTCGLRFKCQEDHRNHMDWHVTKNRTSKNRKQKQSRNWFVSTNLWLSSTEALESDAVPEILPTETVMEKKVDEDMAVPADENQNTCALCGEPFDDFYSHETEEWMYRGAVYLNEPPRSSGNLDRSQFGPIVHAKCRPTSTSISPEDIGLNEWGNVGESRQTKRMRF